MWLRPLATTSGGPLMISRVSTPRAASTQHRCAHRVGGAGRVCHGEDLPRSPLATEVYASLARAPAPESVEQLRSVDALVDVAVAQMQSSVSAHQSSAQALTEAETTALKKELVSAANRDFGTRKGEHCAGSLRARDWSASLRRQREVLLHDGGLSRFRVCPRRGLPAVLHLRTRGWSLRHRGTASES